MFEYAQGKFSDYIKETRQWLEENREFLTDDKDLELKINSPYELKPEKSNGKAVLLVHGLGDSPWYVRDIADSLAEKGWLVRAVLLPGHGSRPEDMLEVDFKDWQGCVAHHAGLLSQECDDVWLAGFSTGGNLVTSYALDNDYIDGLMLFVPGFLCKSKQIHLTPMARKVVKWFNKGSRKDNIFRYDSTTFQEVYLYYKSMRDVLKRLKNKKYSKPVICVAPAKDDVVDSEKTLKIFEKQFINSKSKFIWYGEESKSKDERIDVFPSRVREQNIREFSHVGVVFSPDNEYYGINGDFRYMINKENSDCEFYFSNFKDKPKNMQIARLTWNPHFDEMIEIINNVAK